MALLPWALVGKECPCQGALPSLRCPSAHLGLEMQAQWVWGLEEVNEFLQKQGWDGVKYAEDTHTHTYTCARAAAAKCDIPETHSTGAARDAKEPTDPLLYIGKTEAQGQEGPCSKGPRSSEVSTDTSLPCCPPWLAGELPPPTLPFLPWPLSEHELGARPKGTTVSVPHPGHLSSLGGYKARGFLTGHSGVAQGSVLTSQTSALWHLDREGGHPWQPVFPEESARAWSSCMCSKLRVSAPWPPPHPWLALAPCPPRVALPVTLLLPPSVALSCTHFCLSLSVTLLCASCPGQRLCTTPGGHPHTEVLCGPLPNSLCARLSLGASLTCALFLTGPLAVFFSISYFLLWVCTCTCACLYVCVAPHPSCVCTCGVRPSEGRAQAPP